MLSSLKTAKSQLNPHLSLPVFYPSVHLITRREHLLTTLTPPIPLFPTLQGDPPQQPDRNSQRFQSRQDPQSLTVDKCMNTVLESAIIAVAIRQITLIYVPSQVVRFFRNISPFQTSRAQVGTLTFSTFSTVKSRACGDTTTLPGVSISPLTRSCQTIK